MTLIGMAAAVMRKLNSLISRSLLYWSFREKKKKQQIKKEFNKKVIFMMQER